MRETPFKIYNASAGSGKTYTLVKEYLGILLSARTDRSFYQILAVTFTNKAVNEMKHRVLRSLFDFSKPQCPPSSIALFENICAEFGLAPDFVQAKSKKILKEILHNYAFFDISTIDKFTHRLIRTFAKDLKLPSNFEVVLDTNSLLEEAVDRLLNKAGEEKKLTEVLLAFALEKIEEEKSWDLSPDLNKIGRLIFEENQKAFLEKLENKQLQDFEKLKKEVRKQGRDLEEKAKLYSKSVLQLIEAKGLEASDFPRETLPNHFKKISNSEYDPSKLYNNKLEENLREGKILKSTVTSSSDSIAPEILDIYLKLKALIYQRAFLKNIYKNLVPLTIINRIQQELKVLQEEREQLPISSFNSIISEEIKNQPAPYIYERLGEKYRHYFIDEFQDTSEMQWNNLIPLIGNALEGQDEQGNSGSLLLVGDAKQAIYRWRGGKAEQFLNLLNLKSNPFVVAPEVFSLPSNFRSHDEIITFNNAFFTATGPFLGNEVYKTLFLEGNRQKNRQKKGGLVQLDFLEPNEDLDLHYARQTAQIISEVIEKGYSYEDICILTRKRKQGLVLSDFLMRKGVRVISSETLLLQNSREVIFLINLLRHVTRPDDRECSYELLYYLSESAADAHHFIKEHLENVSAYFLEAYNLDLQFLRKASVFDGLEYALRQLQFAKRSDAYITYLMDEVLDVEKSKGSGISVFLDYWESNREKLSISAPETAEAVNVMTIHKAKGLEFPIVIFPYANSHIYEEIDPKLWVQTNETFAGFDSFLISKKKEVQQYGQEASSLFEKEQYKLELDAFNLLYVALTRAIKGLYVISEKDLNSKGEYNLSRYSGLFIHFLNEKNIWNSGRNSYSFGALKAKSESISVSKLQETIAHCYSFKDRPEFNVLTNSGVLWDTDREKAISKGNLIHQAMSLVTTHEDIQDVVNKFRNNGDIDRSDAKMLKEIMTAITEHPQLKAFYEQGWVVKNESDILLENGLILRPDRVILRAKLATIIDYKTGKPVQEHQRQVLDYANALEAMGYTVEKAIIIYIEDQIRPQFIQL